MRVRVRNNQRFFLRNEESIIYYKADNIGERMELYPTLILTLKEGDKKLFQRYFVFLPTR